MTRFYRLEFILAVCVLSTVLCGCPQLNYKIFIRNRTADTANVTLIYKAPFDPFDTIFDKNIAVRSTNDIVPVRKKSFPLLTDTLKTFADSGKVELLIAPKSTMFVSDILKPFWKFADKSLVIEYADKSDTISANYPYKHLKGFKYKLDPAYNYFYRTIVYFDIK